MDVENKENGSTSKEDKNETLKSTHGHNRHVSSAGDCTVSSLDGIQNGKASPGNRNGESGNNGEIQPMEHSSDKRVEPSAEEDPGKKGMRRMTRGLKLQAQQQKVLDVNTAMKILEQRSQPLIVDHKKLKGLLLEVVVKTEGYEVDRLEKLYARLCQSIYRHRKNHDKTALVQEMAKEVEEFS
ncbi:hypothetical protein HF521_010901 [Silurus meridionalis]|uniref:Uncharacterized protein n=1 Tax=Silurus meridionalis TaxID=175797 RepID=A0A8T0AKU4_SILME|nr:hypothetical protein HF521_010901 [Silurus meridionalis]